MDSTQVALRTVGTGMQHCDHLHGMLCLERPAELKAVLFRPVLSLTILSSE